MRRERNSLRRRIAGGMLIAVLACTLGRPAHADTQGARGGFTIDGVWAAATCGFAKALAKFDPGFYGSALMICSYAEALDQ